MPYMEKYKKMREKENVCFFSGPTLYLTKSFIFLLYTCTRFHFNVTRLLFTGTR